MDDLFNHLSMATQQGPQDPEAHATQLLKEGLAWEKGLIALKRAWFMTQEEAEQTWDKAASQLRYSTMVKG
jgi:hypothetical protein